MNKRNYIVPLAVLLMLSASCKAQGDGDNQKVVFKINTEAGKMPISPYIYGVNDFKIPLDSIADVNVPNRRLGGNSFSTYNWETNYITRPIPKSNNRGIYNVSVSSVESMPPSEEDQPAAAYTYFHTADLKHSMASLITIPMMSYVPKDKNGVVDDNETSSYSRFALIKAFKNGPLSLEPDINDNYVYINECIHFLVNKYGDSKSPTGIKFYALDNEPNYWQWGHRFMHPERPTCEELLSKSIEFAKAIKSQDPYAVIFALSYGSLYAHWNYQDDPTYLKYKDRYPSFTAWFLKNMKDASNAAGKNLIDVIDLHYYSKAQGLGANGQAQMVDVGSNDNGIAITRMNATLSLWNNSFVEESKYTTINGGKALDVIPDLQSAINKYYPGLKISFGEYNFGGWNHISGGIAEADFLGILAKEGVFWASLWNTCPGATSIPHYQLAAIKMFRNYDGKFSTFGNVLVKSDAEITGKPNNSCSVYSSFSSTDSKKLHIIVINKNYSKSIDGLFNLKSANNFKKGTVWILDRKSYKIAAAIPIEKISNNSFKYAIPPLSIVHIVLE